MARRTVITTTSDLSDEAGAETVSYALDGQTYEVDLTDEEAEEFRELFAPYQAVSRPTGGTTKPRKARTRPTAIAKATPKAAGTRPPDSKAVRAWAAAHDVPVPARGRVPRAVMDQYAAEQ